MKKFYITTPIYYVNAEPHIGSAYTTIAADILARWHKLKGEEVFFLTGTDEHGQKIQEKAEEEGLKPKVFVDKISKKFQETFKLLNIQNDNFIRTTDKEHEKEVKKVLQELYDKGYIYKGFYESFYCVGCEQYLTHSDLLDGKCPIHKRVPDLRKEEAYLFKLSEFQNKILKLIKSGEFEILPNKRKNEAINFIQQGLQDISISRLKEKVSWGIELPFDKNHTCFVWVDAFWNYITGLKQKNKFDKFWPADVQLMAKDILRVHTTIWPALLLATGNKLPKRLFIHGYFTVDGEKMSKSLGNVISPDYMVKQYGVDSLRYFLMRNIPFGEDGDFSENLLVERVNNELANELGNLISRVLSLAERKLNGKASRGFVDEKFADKLDVDKISNLMDNIELHTAINEIMRFVKECNRYINEEELWDVEENELEVYIYTLLEAIRIISILLSPYMPQTSEKINSQLNIKAGDFGDCEFGLVEIYKIKKKEILFKKFDVPKPPEYHEKKEDELGFEDFDFRVGEIKGVKDHPNADKLYIEEIDLGKDTSDKLQVVSGLREYYKKEELIGKKVIILRNLKPAVIRGVESQGMLLAAVKEKKLSLLIAPKSRNGGRVFINLREKARKEVTINDFEKILLKTKDKKVVYQDMILRTEEEEIKLDKNIGDNAKIQ